MGKQRQPSRASSQNLTTNATIHKTSSLDGKRWHSIVNINEKTVPTIKYGYNKHIKWQLCTNEGTDARIYASSDKISKCRSITRLVTGPEWYVPAKGKHYTVQKLDYDRRLVRKLCYNKYCSLYLLFFPKYHWNENVQSQVNISIHWWKTLSIDCIVTWDINFSVTAHILR